MGFLDHTTNNIIVDAVLTDKGRQKLASSNGLKIIQYAFADTEVDYTLLKKYGEIVGREKIEKNTPIFEADTGGFVVDKHTFLQDATAGNVQVISSSTNAITQTSASFDITFSGFDASQNLSYEIVYNRQYFVFDNDSGGTAGARYPIGDPGDNLRGIQVTATANSNGTYTTTLKFSVSGNGDRVASFSVSEQGGASSGVQRVDL